MKAKTELFRKSDSALIWVMTYLTQRVAPLKFDATAAMALPL